MLFIRASIDKYCESYQRFPGIWRGSLAVSPWENWLSGVYITFECNFFFPSNFIKCNINFQTISNLVFCKYKNLNVTFALESLVISLLCMQDVSDVLTAIDYVIDMGLVDRAKISVLGGSHGGFLTTHLIGQVQ